MEMTTSERVRSTQEAVEYLQAALRDAGVALPSLGVDPVTAATGEPLALVELGRCNVRTAVRLADALRGAGGQE